MLEFELVTICSERTSYSFCVLLFPLLFYSDVKKYRVERFLHVLRSIYLSTISSIDPAPYLRNLFKIFLNPDILNQQLISKGSPRAYKLNGTTRLINDHCTINDDGEFPPSHKYIYLKQLELKLEHQEEHAKFLDLDITIENNILVYKLFNKRDKFPFFIVIRTCRAIFHRQYSMAQYCQSSQ